MTTTKKAAKKPAEVKIKIKVKGTPAQAKGALNKIVKK